MSIQIVKEVVSTFLSDAEPGVLVIKGAWGVGKTHAWNALLSTNSGTLKIPQYSYASLFGQKSVSDLRTALVANSIPSKFVGKPFDWSAVKSEWGDLMRSGGRRLIAFASRIKPSIPYIKEVSVPFDSVAGFLLNDAIICLDDWERTNIPFEELLGFVSELKNERNCKVVLIFNDGRLDDDQKKTLKDYHEKVVDIEVVYEPTSQEAVDIAIKPDHPHADLLKDKITRLDIKNIRLIYKILTLLSVLGRHIKTARPVIQEQVVATTVLMAWVHYGEASPRKPSIEFVRAWNNIGAVMRMHADKKPTEEEQRWGSTLNGFGYTSTDELDLAVEQVIERGYWQGTSLVEQLQSQERTLAAADVEQSFAAAWETFHGSFAHNEQEVITALSTGLRNSVKFVSPMNLNGTISVLRQLNQNALADELIDFYVESRKDETGLFDLENNPFGGEVTDKRIRERFAEFNVAIMKKPSLFDAVTAARKSQGWSREAGQVIDDATVDEIYATIMADNGGSAGREFLRSSEWLSSVTGKQDYRGKFRQALTRIADGSPLNAARVRRYGVQPTQKDP